MSSSVAGSSAGVTRTASMAADSRASTSGATSSALLDTTSTAPSDATKVTAPERLFSATASAARAEPVRLPSASSVASASNTPSYRWAPGPRGVTGTLST